MRHMNMESIYEYGSRAGFWRLHRMFAARSVPVTVCAVATAMARNVEAIAAMNEAGWKIATHGLRWIDYRDTPPDVEAPYRRGDRHPHRGRGRAVTRLLPGPFVDEHHPARDGGGRLFYCGGSYADDLPYWFDGPRGLQLITPYTLDSNDMRFATPQGFNSGGQFYAYLKDTFGTLYAEGDVAPKMLSVGLHCRLVGCPGRAASLARLIRPCARPRSRLGPDAARHRPPRDLQAPAARWLEALAAHPHAVPRAVRGRLRTFRLGRGGSL